MSDESFDAFLLTLQEETACRLQSDPRLANVPVLVRRRGLIESDVQTAIGVANQVTGKCGAVMVVMMPTVDNPEVDSPGPQIDALINVRVIEKPTLNRGSNGTGISAEQLAIRALRLLHLWRLDSLTAQVRSDRRPITPATIVDPKSIGYDVFARARTSLDANAVAAPKFTLSAGSLQMGCNTHAASIWYTTDGSYPIPDAGTATLYTVPFSPPAQTLVRAGGYKADMIPSNVARLWIS